jgi:hypothetical protein
MKMFRLILWMNWEMSEMIEREGSKTKVHAHLYILESLLNHMKKPLSPSSIPALRPLNHGVTCKP